MLSKSKGQILRVAATFHVLFHLDRPEVIPQEISEGAITAAITFVGMCCQQTVFVAGRGDITEEIRIIKASPWMLNVRQLHLVSLHVSRCT